MKLLLPNLSNYDHHMLIIILLWCLSVELKHLGLKYNMIYPHSVNKAISKFVIQSWSLIVLFHICLPVSNVVTVFLVCIDVTKNLNKLPFWKIFENCKNYSCSSLENLHTFILQRRYWWERNAH